MSVTWNSSKQSSQSPRAMAAAASRIGSSPLISPRFDLLPERVDALVHVGHEFVEMHAALALDRRRREEQIHQHGLAAADLAENVEALDRLLRALARAEQPAERGRFARQPMLGEPRFERASWSTHRFLGGVALDLSGGDEGRILHRDGSRHERE